MKTAMSIKIKASDMLKGALRRGELDWNWILGEIKESLEFKSDREMAGYLKISVAAINQFRNGQKSLPLGAKLRALDSLAFLSLSEATTLLTDEEVAQKIKAFTKRTGAALAERGAKQVESRKSKAAFDRRS